MRVRWCLPLFLGLPLVLAAADETPRADPFPLKRIQISPDRVATELERAQKGALVLLPRSEFEDKVQRAALAQEQTANPPRLTRTVYSARLVGQSLVGGAEWWVLHTVPGPGLLPVPDLNLALAKRPKVDGVDGILGDLDGKTLALWIEKPGRPSVLFDWSRRCTMAADGLHFDLEIPACSDARLDLVLPRNYRLVANQPGLLASGPQPADDPGERTWQLSFSGRSHIEFVLRSVEEGNPLLLATVQSRQEIGAERVQADFEFQIEGLHGSTSELVFDVDTPLAPYEVSIGGVLSRNWKWQPQAKDKATASTQLTLSLPDRLSGALPAIQVRCLAAVAKDRNWTSPGLRLRGSLGRGETLKLVAAPPAQLESWKPGHFRLVKSTENTEGTRELTLVHGGLALRATPAWAIDPAVALATGVVQGFQATPIQRPSAVLKNRTTEVLVRQQAWWQIEAQGSQLTCELICQVNRGRLYHLPLKLPVDSQVDQVQIEPKECQGTWASAGSSQSPVLLIDLAQPATPQTPVRIKLQLRMPPRIPSPATVTLPLPDVEPLVACLREGSLAISVHPRWRAEVLRPSVMSSLAPEDEYRAQPDYYFPFRGAALTGALRLNAAAMQFQARLASDAYLDRGRGSLRARLTLEPAGGSLDHVDLLVSSAAIEEWKVRTEVAAAPAVSVQRLRGFDFSTALLLAGVRQPLEALGPAALETGLQRWRLRFEQPLRGRTVLSLEAPFAPAGKDAAAGAQQTWTVPVITVAGAEGFESSLSIQVSGAEVTALSAGDLKEVPYTRAAGGKSSTRPMQQWQVFSYDLSKVPARPPVLQVKMRNTSADLPAQETCDFTTLTTCPESERQLHHWHFRLWNWRKKDLSVRLPGGATLLAARIDGRWISGLVQRATPAGLEVDLPASARRGTQQFDVYYATPGGLSTWSPWDTLAADLPELPVPAVDLRRSWLLPPGVVPLSGARQRFAEPGLSADLRTSGSKIWRLGQVQLQWLLQSPAGPDWVLEQHQRLASAEASLRAQFGAPDNWVLGPVLESLALDHAHLPVVVDAEALSAANLGAISAFASAPVKSGESPWSALQLVFVPTPAGLLLTTRSQWQAWGAGDYAGPGALADAVGQAAQTGHDASGRFVGAVRWVRGGAYQTAVDGDRPEHNLGWPESFGPDWTIWDAQADATTAATLHVVRPAAFVWLGLLMSLALALVWYTDDKSHPSWNQWRLRVLLLGATGAVIVWLGAPPPCRAAAGWPALTLTGILTWCWCRAVFRRRRQAGTASKSSVQARAVIAAAIVLLGVGMVALSLPFSLAQGPDPGGTVLLLPPAPGNPDKQDVLVTPELLKKLDGLTRRGPAGLRGAALLDAHYDITQLGNVAQGKAEFQIQSFGDRAPISIPLVGVELREGSLLDGAAVQPVATAGGYELTVKEAGSHRLVLLFNIRMHATATCRDLQFGVPRVPSSRLQVQVPADWAKTQVLTGLGHRQATTLDAQNRNLIVDLGRESAIHLRWPLTEVPVSPAKSQVREFYWWDLRQPAAEGTAVLQYKVATPVAHLVVAVPDTLEPRSVDVMGDGSGEGDAARPRLREWWLVPENNQWRLYVALQAPVSGDIVLTVHLVPRMNIGVGSTRLPLLVPVGAQTTEGFVAYRVDGLEARDKGANLTTQPLSPEQFAKLWQAGGIREQVLPTGACSFRTRPADAGVLVTFVPLRPVVEQDLQWKTYADRVELLGNVKIASPGGDLLLLEWEIPQMVTVAEITGENVRSWTRPSGESRVQIWLKQPARHAQMSVRGWVVFPKTPAGAGPGGKTARWVVPAVRCPDAISTRTLLRLVEDRGIQVEVDAKSLVNLTPQTPEAGERGKVWLCQAPQGYYRLELIQRAVPLPPRVLGITTVEMHDQTMHLTDHLQVQIMHGQATSFEVRATGWPEGSLKLGGPAEVKIVDLGGRPGEPSWRVTVPAGVPRRLLLKLIGQRSCEVGKATALPAIQLSRADWSGRWLIAHEPGLEVQFAWGLVPVKNLGATDLPPGLAERLHAHAALWQIAGFNANVLVVPRRPAATPDVQVLFGQRQSAFGEGFGWIHQALFLVYAKDSYELTVDMPEGAVLTAAVDGEAVGPRPLGADRFALPLPSGEGLRRVRLRWVFAEGTETLLRPRLAAPKLDAAPELIWYGSVTLPSGYGLAATWPPAIRPGALAAAQEELARAEALASVARLLIERFDVLPDDSLRAEIALVQKRLAESLRLTGHQLENAPPQDVGDLKQRLEELRQHNAKALHEAGLDKLRTSPEKSAPSSFKVEGPWLLPARGQTLYWHASAGSSPPALEVQSAQDAAREHIWVEIAAMLVLLAGLLVLTTMSRVVNGLARLWPEQFLLLALAGSLLWGFSLVAAVLVAAALAVRLALTLARLRHVKLPAAEGSVKPQAGVS
jgi:hypothetical protein